MANLSETQFPMESTTFMAHFYSIVSTINETMAEKPIESTMLSTILDWTTASGPKCTVGYSLCDAGTNNPCNSDNGICCTQDGIAKHCVCKGNYTGKFCHRKKISFSTGIGDAPVTVIFSALIGVIVIALFIAVVVLQFKYYNNRKKRLQTDKEIRKSMRVKPEIRRKDDASTRLLRTQPGYSWRQSVRRSTYASQKSKGLSMSLSVPENLFEIGLTKEREKGTNQTKSGDGGGGEGEGERGGGAAGSEIFGTDPVNSSSTVQLLHDKDPSMTAVQFDSRSDVIHL